MTAVSTEHTGWGSEMGGGKKSRAMAGIPSFLYKQAAGFIQGNPAWEEQSRGIRALHLPDVTSDGGGVGLHARTCTRMN